MPTPIEADVKRVLAANGRGAALRQAILKAWADVGASPTHTPAHAAQHAMLIILLT